VETLQAPKPSTLLRQAVSAYTQEESCRRYLEVLLPY